ncbi:tail completion protein gp17 [Immundisolibacter sp.]
MITEVRNRIYALGSGVTGLSGRFYFMEAPQNTTQPFATFSFITNVASRDSATKFENITFQIDIFGNTLTTIETIEHAIKVTFDEAENVFTLNNYHCDRIEREITNVAKYDNTFQITVQYRLELTKI